jgi:hypothetical protein
LYTTQKHPCLYNALRYIYIDQAGRTAGVRVFKTKWFRRFARREGIAGAALCDAVLRANRGRIDADLGRGVIKQRVARRGEGRSGGYRTLIVYRARDRAIFVFGFAKSERENIEPDELEDLRMTAKLLLGYTMEQLDEAVANDELWELKCDDEALQE